MLTNKPYWEEKGAKSQLMVGKGLEGQFLKDVLRQANPEGNKLRIVSQFLEKKVFPSP